MVVLTLVVAVVVQVRVESELSPTPMDQELLTFILDQKVVEVDQEIMMLVVPQVRV